VNELEDPSPVPFAGMSATEVISIPPDIPSKARHSEPEGAGLVSGFDFFSLGIAHTNRTVELPAYRDIDGVFDRG
jgi:hypothetical protein